MLMFIIVIVMATKIHSHPCCPREDEWDREKNVMKGKYSKMYGTGDIILCKISQTKKHKNSLFYLICIDLEVQNSDYQELARTWGQEGKG